MAQVVVELLLRIGVARVERADAGVDGHGFSARAAFSPAGAAAGLVADGAAPPIIMPARLRLRCTNANAL